MLVEVGANDGHVRDSLVGRNLPSAQEPDSNAGSVIIMHISCQRFEGIGRKYENGVLGVVLPFSLDTRARLRARSLGETTVDVSGELGT